MAKEILYHGKFRILKTWETLEGDLIKTSKSVYFLSDCGKKFKLQEVDAECLFGGYPLCKNNKLCKGCPKEIQKKIKELDSKETSPRRRKKK